MFLQLLLLFLVCGFVRTSSDAINEDEGVLVLTQKNFKEAISSNEYILVEFYAPWCGHCKALAPEYVKAAAKLKELGSNIRLGKVDATEESNLAEEHNVRGYPTLKFFKGGNPLEYTGGRQADDIVNWVTKKSGPPAKPLSSLAELKEFLERDDKVCIVGLFSDESSDAAKSFLQVADSIDESPFAISSEAELLKEYNVDKNKVIVFKKFDEPKAEIDEINDFNQLRNEILAESLPLIVEFNHESAQKVFGGSYKSHLLLFMSKKEGHIEQHLPKLRPLAKKFRSHLLFVSIDVDEPDHSRILDFFGLSAGQVPTMRIIRLEEEMYKYKPEIEETSPENVELFVQDYIDGKLKMNLLSQPLPDDWDQKPVKVLVVSNFDEIAFNKEKHVLVEFYAPWCGHCKQLAPIYDKLAESYESRDDIVIAKMDATVNELEHTKVISYPTIKLYKKGDNEVVEYKGERTLEGLTKFIESGGEYGAGPESVPVAEEEEEEHDDAHPKDEL